jgi:DNA-binding transcriptional ArsR family regulator
MKKRRETLRPYPLRDVIINVMRVYGAPISPTQISRIVDGSLGSIAYHVKTLVSAGLVAFADEGQVRGAAEHFYKLVNPKQRLTDPAEALMGICDAVAVPGADGGFPRLGVVDGPARIQLEKLVDNLRPEVQRIILESTDRAA